MICHECRYYCPFPGEQEGECHRFPKAIPTDVANWCGEFKKPSVQKERKPSGKIPFEQSEYYDKDKFYFALRGWNANKIEYYYNQAEAYSKANGGRYLDWIMAVKSWDRKKPYNPPIEQIQHENRQRYNREFEASQPKEEDLMTPEEKAELSRTLINLTKGIE